MCGGSYPCRNPDCGVSGLSPRARGKQSLGGSGGVAARSIPACAGEARARRSDRQRAGVYPRVCGGSKVGAWPGLSAKGLSPRVRGKRLMVPRYAVGQRSIPACAGEAMAAKQRKKKQAVYPRVCGGSCRRRWSIGNTSGLSPRVRGKPTAVGRRRNLARSIPACAGEALPQGIPATARRVYPRVCGGSSVAANLTDGAKGLSPRVRGKRGAVG